ncbi:unnamed protein product [Clavelina lepadiformis]|uniref:Ferroptosis suppressor protein 1 n=1 Tax=Clavelina lepadiformis TaxID=159417 RepID=A0ABP0GGS5_CLALP
MDERAAKAVKENMKVVIVGGGYGGAYLGYKIIKENLCKVTVIDPKDGMFHNVGALRTLVDKSYENKLFVPYDQFLGKSFLRQSVKAINTKSKFVTLDDNTVVSYTHLVIASGCNSPFPGGIAYLNNIKEALKCYDEMREGLMKSKRVIVVGGGAVGVELVGEIKTDFPSKEVTLIHSRHYLTSERGNESYQLNLLEVLQKKQINLHLGEKVVNLNDLRLNKYVEGQKVKTEKRELECDMVVACIGTTANNAFFKDELGSALNDSGLLRVNSFLQVNGHEDVFAIGDINNVPEEKMAYTAKLQADQLFANWLAGNDKWEPYKTGAFVMIVPIGRDSGVGLFQGQILDSASVSSMKGQDLFADRIWGDLGLTPPN